jgi:RNA 2',3'-cyclic 3'-phosphodiesterase
VRLFYALVPSEAEKQNILRWQENLETASESGRFPPTENLHMTLQFLGEIQTERVKTLKEILTATAGNYRPFSITLDSYAWFQGKGQERLWYLTGSSPEATKISRELGEALAGNGFSVEDRVFIPHITLARRCKLKNRRIPEEAEPVPVQVQRLWLMESRQIRGCVVYVPVFHAGMR